MTSKQSKLSFFFTPLGCTYSVKMQSLFPTGISSGCLFSSLCSLFQTFSTQNGPNGQELSLQAVWLDKTLAAFQCERPFFILKWTHAWREEAGGVEFNRVKGLIFCSPSVLLQGHLFCSLFKVKRDFQWHLCPKQWNRPRLLCWLCR